MFTVLQISLKKKIYIYCTVYIKYVPGEPFLEPGIGEPVPALCKFVLSRN